MITPLDDTVKSVMEFTWPMILICVLLVSSLRITDIVKNKKEFVLYKELLTLCFMIYILCLFQIVTFEDPYLLVTDNHFNLVPFQEIFRYQFGSRLFFKNVIGNLVLFVPYGFFTGFFTKLEKYFHAFFLILFSSISIEMTQLAIGRVFDIDDILLNIIGGLLGFFIYRCIAKFWKSLPKVFHSKPFLNGLAILIILILIGYIGVVLI
ncbi:MAG: VanZ family protein [Firmicutes bacterium]|nr:VanZ family protein [Bacillota bacterium]